MYASRMGARRRRRFCGVLGLAASLLAGSGCAYLPRPVRRAAAEEEHVAPKVVEEPVPVKTEPEPQRPTVTIPPAVSDLAPRPETGPAYTSAAAPIPVRLGAGADPEEIVGTLGLRIRLLALQCGQESVFLDGTTGEISRARSRSFGDGASSPLAPLLRWQCELLRREIAGYRRWAVAPGSLADAPARAAFLANLDGVSESLDEVSRRYRLDR